MKIHWEENPLDTVVETDERDRKMILYYLQSESYSNLLCSLDLQLTGQIRKDDPPLTLEDVKERISKWGEICNMDTDHEEVQLYVDYLTYGHCGDCTCLAATCLKCIAEDALGINTIKGLGKHSAHKIQNLFLQPGATIDSVLEKLSQPAEYKKPDTWPEHMGYEQHIPRWKKEREQAYTWLKSYKEEKGF